MHLGNPVHCMFAQLTQLSRTSAPRLGNIAYAINCAWQKLALQLEEAALSFSCFAIVPVFMSVQVFMQPYRKGDQGTLLGWSILGQGRFRLGQFPQMVISASGEGWHRTWSECPKASEPGSFSDRTAEIPFEMVVSLQHKLFVSCNWIRGPQRSIYLCFPISDLKKGWFQTS